MKRCIITLLLFCQTLLLLAELPTGLLKTEFLCEEPDNLNYLILTTDDFREECEILAQWRTKLGFNVDTIIINRFQDKDYSDINFWLEKYNRLIGKRNYNFITILGDTKYVPSQKFHYSFDPNDTSEELPDGIEDEYYSDFNYGAGISSSNIVSEVVCLGRIAASNHGYAAGIIRNIVDYESNPPEDEDYYKNATFIGHIQGEGGVDSQGFIYNNEMIASTLESNYNKTPTRLYHYVHKKTPVYKYSNYGSEDYIDSKTISFIKRSNILPYQVADAFNSNCSFLFYNGHGSLSGWAEPEFSISNLGLLDNWGKLPIVVAGCCKTMNLSPDPITSFAQQLMASTTKATGIDTQGCLAYFGSSAVAYSGYTAWLQFGLMDALWPNNVWNFTYNYPKYTKHEYTSHQAATNKLGLMLNHAKHKMIMYFNEQSRDLTDYNARIFHLFGDPGMSVYTEKPSEFERPIIIAEYLDSILSYSISGPTDVDRITVYEDGTLWNKTKKGTTINVQNKERSPNYWVCMTGKNKIPYFERLPVPEFPVHKGNVSIQNETLTGQHSYDCDIFTTGSDIMDDKPHGKVTITAADIEVECTEFIIKPETEISSDSKITVKFTDK